MALILEVACRVVAGEPVSWYLSVKRSRLRVDFERLHAHISSVLPTVDLQLPPGLLDK